MGLLFTTITLFLLYFLYLIKSFVFCFVPRRFRWKKIIKGQKILITGAGSGLGRQLAIQFSKHSACIIMLDRDKAAMLMTEKMMERQSTVFLYQCDVSDRKMVHEVAEKIKKEVGDVDILINNAGVVSGKYLLDLTEEEIVRTMKVNALAHFWMCQAFLPAMIARNSGHIVSVASIAGKGGVPRLTDYVASKFAAVGFAESLEVEMREKGLDGIKVTIVCPSHIDTGLFDGVKVKVGGTMTPEYVANEIVNAVLEEQEIIYLPKIFKYIIMTKDFFPRWLLIWFAKTTGDIKCMQKFTGKIAKHEVPEQKKVR